MGATPTPRKAGIIFRVECALTDFDVFGLSQQFARWGCKPSHAQRLLQSFYDASGHVDLDKIEIGRELKSRFGTDLKTRSSRIATRHTSGDGTTKLLIGFDRGGAVEAVLMPAFRPDRAAGCISSQIGCAMGCDFCASTKSGLQRNLEAGEIVEQFLHLRQLAQESGRRLTTLVFMGMGEPLQNLSNVLAATRRIADPIMGNLGWKRITISTVGVVPGIDQLAAQDIPVYLALSLHAPDDLTRGRIVPANRRWPVAEVMAAARRFEAATGRTPNIEYCMLAGVNDSDEQARLLADLMEGFRAHVNLIPYNWIGTGLSGVAYQKPSPRRVEQFLNVLRDRNVVCHVRVTRGDDVNAACGQLQSLVRL